jgi:hypothetical protein
LPLRQRGAGAYHQAGNRSIDVRARHVIADAAAAGGIAANGVDAVAAGALGAARAGRSAGKECLRRLRRGLAPQRRRNGVASCDHRDRHDTQNERSNVVHPWSLPPCVQQQHPTSMLSSSATSLSP